MRVAVDIFPMSEIINFERPKSIIIFNIFSRALISTLNFTNFS